MPPDDFEAKAEMVRSKLSPRLRPGDEGFEERVLDAMADARLDPDDEGESQRYIARLRELLQAASHMPKNQHASPQRPGGPTGPPQTGLRGGGGQPGGHRDESGPSAPYRFVALNDIVVPAAESVIAHGMDRPLPRGFCGAIDVEWAAETPLLIGARQTQDASAVDAPLRIGDRYVIPGATLRGLLRATCEIIAYGRLFQVNRHHRYAVRDFSHPLFQDDARPDWASLHAGWLRRVPEFDAAKYPYESGYEIVPCSKYLIRIRALPDACRQSGETDGLFHRRWLGLTLAEKHKAAKQQANHGRGRLFDFVNTGKGFAPGSGAEDVMVVPDANGPLQGFLIFAGRSPTLRDITPEQLDEQDKNPCKGNQKKYEYVFVDNDARPVSISLAAFRRFELAHTKPSKNKRQPDGSYAVLHPTLAGGGRIPVFYIGSLDEQDDPDFSIGLTRLFKRSHRYSVDDVLAREVNHRLHGIKEFKPDMVEGLFGYVFEPDELGKDADGSTAPREIAHKGRISFGFATAESAACREHEQVATVMMGPRASFGPFYLRGDKDWTADHARLAGRKRYFPRFADLATTGAREAVAAKVFVTLKGWTGENAETQSRLQYLESASPDQQIVFRGTIRVHNVSAEELGMLLWALTHGGDPAKPFRHMLGRGKAAGAGQVRVKTVLLKLAGNDAAADGLLAPPEAWEQTGDGLEGWTDGPQSLAPFLRQFEDYMRAHISSWPLTAPVLECLGAASPSRGEAATRDGRAVYLALSQFREVRKLATAAERPPWNTDRLLAAPRITDRELRAPYRGQRKGDGSRK